ncbi:hypothetical protein BEH_07655 [Priestia filamentosa]|uniref:Uncharacterized protein n=1 Tax=Priestia filamentosa TaxID=1402861 RepID=A0A0H4KED8_9BACI|nr:site-specific integrase [Priestia filamentosa]AKO91985.1 hypothetical protein BEH_07655 [Priestia filamentosa]
MEAKVLAFDNGKSDNYKVYEIIEKFLDFYKYNDFGKANNTARNYKSHINHFFDYLKKDIRFLTVEDIQITVDDVERYMKYMKNSKDNTASTIKTKVGTINKLYEEFYKKDLVKDLKAFDTKLFKKLNTTSQEIDAFTANEIEAMVKVAGEDREKPLEKQCLLKLAATIGFRIGDLLNLTWSDFAVYDEYVLVKARQPKRGNAYANKISHELYEEILEIKSENASKDNKVFNFVSKTVERMMTRYTEKIGIQDERSLSFHSIRKFAITNFYSITKDFYATQLFANHKEPSTTKKYIKYVDDYGVIGLFNSNKEDTNELNDISEAELRAVIKSLTESQKLDLLRKHKELFG